MPDVIDHDQRALPPPRRRFSFGRSLLAGVSVVAALAAGGALGATGMRYFDKTQPQSVMLLTPSPVGAMKPDTVVAVRGEVVEIYGNKFIVVDDTGRALVDTGPRGESRPPAAKGEIVTVQGRFDRGVVRAQMISHADGRTEAFGGPHGPKGPKEHKHDKDGPKGPKEAKGPPPPDDDRAPPPAPADGKL